MHDLVYLHQAGEKSDMVFTLKECCHTLHSAHIMADMLKRIGLAPTIAFLIAVAVSAQQPEVIKPQVLESTFDTTNWQTIDLPVITFKLPREFQKVDLRCYHYDCDLFESKGIRIVISYTGLLYSTPATRAKPDFRESSLKVDGLVAQVFQYTSDGEFRYQATFPSDEIGKPVANFQFRSKEPAVANFAASVIQTVRLKAKLKGAQRIYLARECPVPGKAAPEPLSFEDLVKRVGTTDDGDLAREIRARRISFDPTPERREQVQKLGIGQLASAAVSEIAKEMEEQVRVCELFVANYNVRELEKLKLALNAGREFLARWECDPAWEEHVKFIRPWLRRLEHQIGYPW